MLDTLQTTLAWVHDLDPVLVRLGPVPIRWYGLSYICGFIGAWLVLKLLGKKGWSAIKPESVSDLMLALILGVFIGGRLGYVLFYRPSLLWTFEPSVPFWGLLAVNQGGMASHGGLIGVVLAAIIWSRRNTLPAWHTLDALALVAPLGLFFGRLANFVNGELLGRIAAPPGEPAPPHAIKFPQELLERRSELMATLDETQTAELVQILDSQLTAQDHVMLSQGLWDVEQMLDVAAYRLIEAVRAGDRSIIDQLEPLLSSRHPSQLYQAFAEGIVVMAAVWFVARKPRRPAVVSAWFLIVYGVGRITTEFWRLPDAHFEQTARLLGLSRGQWLSALMVVAGVIVLTQLKRFAAEPRIGGWQTTPTK